MRDLLFYIFGVIVFIVLGFLYYPYYIVGVINILIYVIYVLFVYREERKKTAIEQEDDTKDIEAIKMKLKEAESLREGLLTTKGGSTFAITVTKPPEEEEDLETNDQHFLQENQTTPWNGAGSALDSDKKVLPTSSSGEDQGPILKVNNLDVKVLNRSQSSESQGGERRTSNVLLLPNYRGSPKVNTSHLTSVVMEDMVRETQISLRKRLKVFLSLSFSCDIYLLRFCRRIWIR